MVDRARKLLDSLMGRERNIVSDENACYFYTLGLCPVGLLEKTRRKMGTCKFRHIVCKIPENTIRRHELRLLKLLLQTYTKFIPRETPQDELKDNRKAEEIKALNAEIGTLISKLHLSENMLASMEQIESKKLLVEKINESLFANSKGLCRDICRVCHGRITPSDTHAKIAKHNSGRIHMAFQEMRSKIGEIAHKYNIREYDPSTFDRE